MTERPMTGPEFEEFRDKYLRTLPTPLFKWQEEIARAIMTNDRLVLMMPRRWAHNDLLSSIEKAVREAEGVVQSAVPGHHLHLDWMTDEDLKGEGAALSVDPAVQSADPP